MAPERGVLVTGSHRAGTTWTGRVLTASGELAYVDEPFNVVKRVPWMVPSVPHGYQYVSEANEDEFAGRVDRMIALRYPAARGLANARAEGRLDRHVRLWARSVKHRLERRPPLVKDPLALFSTPWLVRRYGLRPVILVRNPLAFAGSLKDREWDFDFGHWLRQPLLVRDLLGPWRGEIEAAAAGELDLVGQAVVQWRVLYGVVQRFEAEHPDWIVRRHEDLAADPLGGFRDLHAELGLTWSPAVAREVEASSTGAGEVDDPMAVRRDSRAALETWKDRLTDDERARVVDATADVARHWYPNVIEGR